MDTPNSSTGSGTISPSWTRRTRPGRSVTNRSPEGRMASPQGISERGM